MYFRLARFSTKNRCQLRASLFFIHCFDIDLIKLFIKFNNCTSNMQQMMCSTKACIKKGDFWIRNDNEDKAWKDRMTWPTVSPRNWRLFSAQTPKNFAQNRPFLSVKMLSVKGDLTKWGWNGIIDSKQRSLNAKTYCCMRATNALFVTFISSSNIHPSRLMHFWINSTQTGNGLRNNLENN